MTIEKKFNCLRSILKWIREIKDADLEFNFLSIKEFDTFLDLEQMIEDSLTELLEGKE